MSVSNDQFLSLGGTDLSAWLEGAEPTFEEESGDDTVQGDVSRSMEPGLVVHSLSATFKNVFDDNGPDEIIDALFGTTFAVIWAPNGSTESASNPKYGFTAKIRSWRPTAAKVGEVDIGTLELEGAGGAARTRDITP